MAVRSKGSTSEFQSKLGSGAERFLARVVVHALENHWRSPSDFVRHFTPIDLMEGLEAAPDLRAELLVNAAGVHERIASKKSTSSGAEDLQIALDEGICDTAKVLELLPPDDRIRYLNHGKLWTFATEDEFWTRLNAEANREQVSERLTFILETAISEGLVSLQQVTDGIGFDTIADRLPAEDLRRVVKHAFAGGRTGQPLTDESLLEVVPLSSLLSFLPLELVWEKVIVGRVVEPAGFLTGGSASPRPERRPSTHPSRPPPPPKPESAFADGAQLRKSVPPPKPVKRSSVPPPPPIPTGDQPLDLDVSVDELMDASPARTSQEQDARRRVTDKLAGIERLPPNHAGLPTPILLSIESMYAELPTLLTDEEREACIRESFPNEAHLTQAMLALIELLDPSIDITDPVIRDADIESLMKVVLFEERHRSDQGRPSQLPSSALPPPPPSNRKKSIVPPPLPRGVSAPPPLPGHSKS